MRPGLLLFVFLLGAIGFAPPALAGETRTEGGHVVRWDDGLDGVGAQVASLLPRIQREVEVKLGFSFPEGPATVVVVKGLESMREAARAHVPEWAAGVCVGRNSLIVLRAERMLPATPARSVTTVLRHEWVHLAWSRKARFHVRNLPLWAEEGLAEEIGGGTSVDGGAELDYAAAWGRLIPWSEIETRFPAEASKAGLAYRQGASWIRYYIKQAGWRSLQALLGDIANGRGAGRGPAGRTPFDQALRMRTERGLDLWTAAWRVSLEEEARPWFHLLGHDIGWTLIILLSLVSLALFFAVRRKRRAAIEALPDG